MSCAVAVTACIFIIAGNKKAEKKSERLILGFSQIGSESAWRTRNTQSIFEAAAENDIQIIFDDAQQKQENQIKAIRSFIIYQVDVIAFVPIVEDGWDSVLREAKNAGIPVILVDREINADKSLYAGFLGEDSLEEGRKAAKFLMEKCTEDDSPVNILEITGTENASIVKGRAKGFRETLGGSKKFRIINCGGPHSICEGFGEFQERRALFRGAENRRCFLAQRFDDARPSRFVRELRNQP